MKEDILTLEAGTEKSLDQQLRELLHEWFVVYNPLYFTSALCFLVGVYMGSQELGALAWRQGDIALLGIIQIYEFALLGAAAILWLAGERRPATILLLLETLFLFDPTFEIETITHLEPWDWPLAAVWLLLAGVKVEVLPRFLGVRLNVRARLVLLGLVACIVVPPLLLDTSRHAANAIHAITLLAMLGLATVALSGKCRLEPTEGVDEEVGTACLRGALQLATVLSLLHLGAWFFIFEIVPGPLHFAALLGIFLVIAKTEAGTWSAAALLLLVAVLQPPAFSIVAGTTGLVLVGKAYRLDRPGLYGAAILAMGLALHTIGWNERPFPKELQWVDAIPIAALAALAYRKKVYVGLLLAVIPLSPQLLAALRKLERGELSMLLLVSAFLLLALGVGFNLRSRKGRLQAKLANAEEFDQTATSAREH